MKKRWNLNKDYIIDCFLALISILIFVIPIYMALDVIAKAKYTIDNGDVVYSNVLHEELEQVKITPKKNGKNLIETNNGNFTITDVEIFKHIDDNTVVAEHFEYVIYIKDKKKNYYKVEELEYVVYPWEHKSKNETPDAIGPYNIVSDAVYDEVSKYVGVKFDEIKEKYTPCKKEDIKEKLYKSYFL